MRRLFLLVLSLALFLGLAAWSLPPGAAQAASAKSVPPAAPLPAAAVAAMKQIDPVRIKAHVRFLSSDLLEGRGTGQRGGDIAAEYIGTQFELLGLKPLGDKGGYLQDVPMVGISTLQESAVSLVPQSGDPISLRLGDDVVAMDETQNPTDDVDADVIYVGYGIDAPEYNWNDYKGTDVHGKVLLMLVNEPPSDDPNFFAGKALTYYGRWTYKFEEAARKGAVGVLLVHETEMASYGWDVVRNSWSGERSYLKADGLPKLKLASWIQLEIAQRMTTAAGLDLKNLIEDAQKRDFRPVMLPFHVKAHIVSNIRPAHSENVLAVLEGSDAKLRDQAVVISAHFDHLGIRAGQSGDNIYNGAIDNATGCGVLLELARTFVGAKERPKRSIIFAAVTGEEQGLRGSEYFGQHPPIPAGQINLGLNFDGLAPYGMPEEVEVVGAERTSFYSTVEDTADEFGLQIKPDSNPGAGYYYRSDHFSLARVGIPAFSINEGLKYKGHPREWGAQQELEYREKHYHQPSDEFNPQWDFNGIAEITRFGLSLAWKAASVPKIIVWQPGDEFQAVRKASLEGKPSLVGAK